MRSKSPVRIVYWGTYDLGKPRNRILLRGLRENGVEVVECHASIWSGIHDKSRITGWGRRLHLLFRWLSSYPGLILRYLRAPKHDAVVVGYLGQVDVLVLWPFAKLRGVPILLDAFLSLYNTVVEERGIIAPTHPAAHLLYWVEWLACRAADRVVLDTQAHADYFSAAYRLPPHRITTVFVGAEPSAFLPRSAVPGRSSAKDKITVLFYGQCAPLHGVDTIIQAAQMTYDLDIEWVLIGQGQEKAKIREQLKQHPVENLTWIPWVDYDELRDWIDRADICLGIFGDTDKAARVIPNKVFQVLAAGAPIITRDSPAIRELLTEDMPGVYLVPPADADALRAALHRFCHDRRVVAAQPLHRSVAEKISPRAVGATFQQQAARSAEYGR